MTRENLKSKEVWLVQVKHKFDENYEVLGIFENEIDVDTAKKTYLEYKARCGLSSDEFSFMETSYILGNIEY